MSIQSSNNQQSANKRIAVNTVILYLRMLLILAITLYTSRVVLDMLGVDDYGIYNVVGGFVMMFAFLNSAMATASARFIAYEQGTGDISNQKKVYSTSIMIHICIAIVILLISETIGLWFVNYKMVIPDSRLYAANWVYQASIISFVISILTVPLSSSVIAHEKMSLYAYVTVVDSLLKLLIVLFLPYVGFDKLVFYSITLLIVASFDFIVYYVYCKKKFIECQFKINKEKKLFIEMLSFAGWSFVGNFGISAKDYGVNIILNLFFGPAVNAARGVAYQVSSAINGFVSNFQMAANPQITKRYAHGEKESMIALIKGASKFSFYLLAIIIIPVILRADYILDLWLVDVPDFSVLFLQLILIMALVNTMYGPLSTAMLATGKVKIYQITVAVIMFLDVPISYLILNLGASPYSVAVIGIISAFIALLARLFLLDKCIHIGFVSFFAEIIIRNIMVFCVMILVPCLLNAYIQDTFGGLLIIGLFSIMWSCFIIYILGLTKYERNIVYNKLKEFIRHNKTKIQR